MRKYEVTAEDLSALLRRLNGSDSLVPELLALIWRYEEIGWKTIVGNIDLLFNDYMENLRYRYANKYRIIVILTGVSRSTVEAWFNAAREIKIPLIHLEKIADGLRVPLAYFLREDDAWCGVELKAQVLETLWKLEDKLIEGDGSMKLCYGYELAGNGKHVLNVYKTQERAEEEALKVVDTMSENETMILFSAPCDENGKLASNRFNVLKAWGSDGKNK